MSSLTHQRADVPYPSVAFIGGGNMASAIIGGLLQAGCPTNRIQVIEPAHDQRFRLLQQFGVVATEAPNEQLAQAQWIIWAVKPQIFAEAAVPCIPFAAGAAHLSIMAGVRLGAMATCLGTQRIVRVMPNTPALIGQGIAGVFAHTCVSAEERKAVERLLQPTGALVWVEQESQLDAVTALSGSGPAYLFYLLEAMMEAGIHMGLGSEQARQLALGTVAGASALARQSGSPPAQLREQVTSKGGTTHAALQAMEQANVKEAIIKAIEQARLRAIDLGDLLAP